MRGMNLQDSDRLAVSVTQELNKQISAKGGGVVGGEAPDTESEGVKELALPYEASLGSN